MPRRLGDVVESRMSVDGDQYKVADLVGEEFLITAIQEWQGDKGPYMAVKIEIDGQSGFFFSSHTALFHKLEQAAEIVEREPLLAKIVKVTANNPQGFYFDIS